jgi:tRNA nucleotidyltransferase/poly(A) polymerase
MEKAARRIVEKLRLNGHEAFFAGGWVRDTLLRRKPQDVDVATSARPEQVLSLFPNSTAIGAKFGAVQVRLYGRAYDVVTFRTEGAYLDGRRPESVTFSGPRQDAHRRDFTINGLFYDPLARRVIDYVRGKADLQQRIIRTIGPPAERFQEDKLRMLRAVRFACALSFSIGEETWLAVRQHAPEIVLVSGERIRDEVLKIIAGPDPARGLGLLHESGLLAHILPEIEALHGTAHFDRTRKTLSLLKKPSSALAFASLLLCAAGAEADEDHAAGDSEGAARIAEKTCRRLRLSNSEIADVCTMIRNQAPFPIVRGMKRSELMRFMRQPEFPESLELHRAAMIASGSSLENWEFCRARWEEFRREAPALPLITGDDLIALGYLPGPAFGEILRALEDLQWERGPVSKQQALEYVRHAFPPPKTEKV